MSTLLEMGVGGAGDFRDGEAGPAAFGWDSDGVGALAGAPQPQLLIGSDEDGFLLVGAVALDVGPHEVEKLPRSGHFLALADRPEREPCVQWHAETLDRRLYRRAICCHMKNRTGTGLRCHKTCATVVT